jgi:hypothetical protein
MQYCSKRDTLKAWKTEEAQMHALQWLPDLASAKQLQDDRTATREVWRGQY